MATTAHRFRLAALSLAATLVASCSLISLDPYTRGSGAAEAPSDAQPASPAEASPDVDAGPPMRPSYRDLVVADRPLAYFRFEEPFGATVVKSEVATSIEGAIVGQAALGAPGAMTGGSALQLDGRSARVSFGNVFAFAGGAAYAIELWARVDALGDAYQRLWNRDATDARGRQGYTLYVRAGLGIGAERYVDDQLVFLHHGDLMARRWFHVVVTYDGTTMRLFVDGALSTLVDSSARLAESASSFVLGGSPGGYDYFAGSVDELAVYDRALSADEVATHHRAGAGL